MEEEFKAQPQVSPSDQEDMTRKDLVSALYLSVDGGVRGWLWCGKLGREQAERISRESRAWVCIQA